MKFTKMQGCGNDYVYVDCTKEMLADPAATAIKVSDRHFGIGSDGLILVRSSETADFRMTMFNADGSEAEMCGNGIRCVGKFVYDKGLTDKTEITVETLAGIKTLSLHPGADGLIETVTVDMHKPILDPALIPVIPEKRLATPDPTSIPAANTMTDNVPSPAQIVDEPILVGGTEYRMTCISMGNPHAVVFVEDTANFPLEEVGPQFESHPCFPKRVNTEFVQIISPTEINMRVWERGSGETLACGTGTCACVYACILNNKTEDTVLVHLLGGDLTISYDRVTGHIFMTGPAVTVYEGEY